MIGAILSALAGPAVDLVKGWIQGKQDARERKQETRREVVKAREERKTQRMEAKAELRKKGLESTGRALKWASFTVLHYPWAHFLYHHPEAQPLAFLTAGPDWYGYVVVGAHCTIWGLEVRSQFRQ